MWNENIDTKRHIKSTFFKKNLMCSGGFLLHDLDTSLKNSKHPYSTSAQWTKKIHPMIQPEILVKVLVFGEFDVTLMKILISTKNIVIRSPIRPGTASWWITKLIWKLVLTVKIALFFSSWKLTQEMETSNPVGT